MKYRIGQKVTGTVSGVQPYGFFVQLDAETQGLVHISEVTNGYVEDIHDYIEYGEEVEVLIMDIDEYTKQISLSYRALEEVDTDRDSKSYHRRYGKRKSQTKFKSIESKMPQWIDESLEYIKDYRSQKSKK